MNLPNDLPAWLAPIVAALGGAGAVKLLSVWLENRRLWVREYRETLLEQIKQQAMRIQDLEDSVESLQARQANSRETIGQLKEENESLKECVERLERENVELLARLEDLRVDRKREADGSQPSGGS